MPPPPTKDPKVTTRRLRTLGFDLTTYNKETGTWRPRCSQCEALVINGTACHETGCPHQKKESSHGRDG